MRALSLLFVCSFAAATPAFADTVAADPVAELRAAERPAIEDTGIAAFDSVFGEVRKIHRTLDAIQDRVFGAQDRVATALALPAGTPIRMSLWELKQKAGGPVNVEMRDGKPYLTLGGAGSQEAKALVEAVNGAVADLAGIPAEVAQIPAQLQGLVAACQQFPAQLNPALLAQSGLTPLQLPKIAKTLAGNVKATVATPKRVEGLVVAVKDFLTGIPQGLAATKPPVAPVALAKGKGEKAPKGEKPAKAPSAAAGAAPALPAGPIAAMVGSAMTSFRDAEVAQAVQLLGEADAALGRLQSPIDSRELGGLYQSAALVHLVDGNAAAATANVAQALVVDPLSRPDPDLGPEYAKLHKALLKSGVIRTVEVPVSGTGLAYLSGHRVENVDHVTVAEGKHLLQVQKGDRWVTQVVWVEEGWTLAL